MRKYHLAAKIRRRNPYKMIMKKSFEHKIFENLLQRKFEQNSPLKVLCTDITYLPFTQKIAYLSAVKDVASREIVAWNLAGHLEMDLVINTINQMENATLEGALIHSDQGSHYTNPVYAQKVRDLKMVQSMSRKGNCIDNAPIESFFGHLKDDIDYKNCKSFEELHSLIAEYMEYYNHGRRQWELKKMTPVEYRNHLLSGTP
jgi:transposase InsO family protein